MNSFLCKRALYLNCYVTKKKMNDQRKNFTVEHMYMAVLFIGKYGYLFFVTIQLDQYIRLQD
ncbi:hypothetical protein MPS01_20940 [Marinilactibacillus psychrotolerans]|uniref:Uncharacterized protein n=1 Tax=Marinilactibacillus psychrotolerans TaxID=191770 RepID=A0AAV3WQ21_9LACT|nr:hypothetical protein MPS01_20940 [Marinilactibacillus psychrotolerans]GEQ35380.1 hypothetical protein M132T_08880 [Marinilactibacillus psychrotolerans]